MRLLPEAQPELACRYEAMVQGRGNVAARASRGRKGAGKVERKLPRPLRLLRAACGDGGHVNCAGRSAAAVADFRPATSDRALLGTGGASRPAGGAAAWWAAIIIKWRRPPAAVFGFFAVCATDGGFCMELLIEGGKKEEGLTQSARKRKGATNETLMEHGF